ncbi:MAG: metal ABC transporter permease [Ruminococcaceae bacterium]|nr:metal ABC transporter permease [Oscillospiraceae bacterium]
MILEMLSYPFIQRALIAGLLISLCAALLGVSLVLKRYAMIGDGLSHVGFGALAVATAVGLSPLWFTIPVVIVAAVLLLRLNETNAIRGDGAIAVLSTGSLALGVMVVSLTSGMNTDVTNYLFGSILAMSREDLMLSIVLGTVCFLLFLLCYHRIFGVTFDETFARATGVRAGVYNLLLAVLTAITVVLGMRMMGALLISACMIFPALTAMRVCKTFRGVTILAVILSLLSFLIGLTLSYFFAVPTGAGIVLVSVGFFILFSGIGALRK